MSKKRDKKRPDDLAQFKKLRPFMKKIAFGNMERTSMFGLCVKASVVKCFEFNLAMPHISRRKHAFFAMSSLRGICEDLIVLNFLKRLPAADRQKLLIALSSYELAKHAKSQSKFFTAMRPQQSVLSLQDPDTTISKSRDAACAIWNSHGWPNLKKNEMPQLKQIAERQSKTQLAVLYDYLYSLTSAGVHFSTQSLLRSGWGSAPNKLTFSSKAFHIYFEQYCAVYGAFMFCVYFELFRPLLRPGPKELATIKKIRESVLFTPRWPEMVTYEEMNLPPPKVSLISQMIASAIDASTRTRLISRSPVARGSRSASGNRARAVAKALQHARVPNPS